VTALGLAFAAAVVSGAAALVYEVVWLRTLSLVVGHAVDALTAVLAAYMAGLAVGALFSGRLAERLRRPLLTCARIECGRQHGGGPRPADLARAAERGVPWCPRSPQGRYTVEVIARDVAVNPIPGGPRV
jgi:MFS family permease